MYESFLPLITEMRQWSDRNKKVKTPLIKSYVFVKVKKKELAPIYAIPGVVAVLKHLGEPAIVTDVEINNLKIITNRSDATKVVQPFNLLSILLICNALQVDRFFLARKNELFLLFFVVLHNYYSPSF
ncbi:transcription termination/antitermination NusG family protein [Patiriisocius sp. Uisw_017]|jgi:hypothetical protein|uniref:transcription termination/antitermination NusG family protein n=1 Tax=Patiriisocius sp. Uisw_017 TaxID=3230968 RepID=UPI0039EC976B